MDGMTHHEVIISVWSHRAQVCRWVVHGATGTLEPAANADDLEADAAQAVYAQGGALNLSGHYRCPPDLAARATWPEDRREVIRRIAAGCRAKSLPTLASEIDRLAGQGPEPTTTDCQRILEQYRRQRIIDSAQYVILREALSFE